MRIGHDRATICQYDRITFANTILHRYQIIFLMLRVLSVSLPHDHWIITK
jgi:hypothetical protein